MRIGDCGRRSVRPDELRARPGVDSPTAVHDSADLSQQFEQCELVVGTYGRFSKSVSTRDALNCSLAGLPRDHADPARISDVIRCELPRVLKYVVPQDS
jgi:hypothetical protein